MAAERILDIIISARDQASSIITGVIGKLAALGAAISAYFGISSFDAAVKSAADFEAQLDKVIAKTDDGAANFDELKKAAEVFGPEFGLSATEAAEGLEILGAAGLTASQSIATLPPVLALASAESISMEQSAALVTDAVSIMGLGFEDAAKAADVMVKAGLLSNTTALEVGTALKYAGGEARTAGLSLEQTAAALDVLAKNGLRGEQAGTALRSILANLGNPASAARVALTGLGVATGDLNTVIDALVNAGPMGEKAIRAFGVESGPALRALLKEGTAGLQGFTDELLGATGTADTAAKQMQGNLTGSLAKLSAAWDAARRTLVEPLLGPLAEEATKLSETLQKLVSDGRLKGFSDGIVNAFKVAAKSVREFIAEFDFAKALSAFSDFTQKAGSAFSTLGNIGSKTADAIKVAWNGVQIGINAVAGALQITVASALETFSVIESAASKVGLGTLERANELLARAQDWKRYAKDSVDAITRDAGEGAAALSDLVGATDDVTAAQKRLADQSRATGTAAKDAANKAAAAQEDAIGRRIVAESKLRAEYEASDKKSQELIRGLQEYSRLLREEGPQAAGEFILANQNIRTALSGLGSAAESSASAIESAFSGLGISSQESLQQIADVAEKNFITIRDSGVATASDITKAFESYAEKARAAISAGSESETAAIEVKLQSLAKISGITEKQIEQNGRLTESTREYSRAVQENLVVTENNARAIFNELNARTDLSQEEKQALSVSRDLTDEKKKETEAHQTFTALTPAVRQQYAGLSEAAALYFDQMMKGVFTVQTWWDVLSDARFAKVKDEFNALAAEADNLTTRLQSGTTTTLELQQAVGLLAGETYKAGVAELALGNQQLDPLRKALADVRQQTEDATQAAVRLVEELTQAKLQREGDKAAIEKFAYEQELLRIQELERKNADRRVIQDALRLAEEAHRARLREISDEEKAARLANKGTTTQASNNVSGGVSGGGGNIGFNGELTRTLETLNTTLSNLKVTGGGGPSTINIAVDPTQLANEAWIRKNVLPVLNKVAAFKS